MDNNYTDKWGLYPWWPDTSDHSLIHPEDLAGMMTFYSQGKVLHCIGTEGEFLLLQYMDHLFRAKPGKLFVEVQAPQFNYGDIVSEKVSPVKTGIVDDIFWHFKRKCPYFLLVREGKKSSKWYFAEDLELVEKSQNKI